MDLPKESVYFIDTNDRTIITDLLKRSDVIDLVIARGGYKMVRLLSRLGTVFKVKNENDLDSLTLLIGCAPAIVAYCIELLTYYAKLRGLGNQSLNMVLDSFKGTINFLEKKQIAPESLMDFVSTKGGVTEAILFNLEKKSIKKLFEDSLRIGASKIQIMKTQLAVNKFSDRI